LKDGGEAGRIVANLKNEGYSAYLSRIVLPEKGLWFRVRVGSYVDEKQAASDMERLAKDQKKPILLSK
jgi:cell division septation protein DedD